MAMLVISIHFPFKTSWNARKSAICRCFDDFTEEHTSAKNQPPLTSLTTTNITNHHFFGNKHGGFGVFSQAKATWTSWATNSDIPSGWISHVPRMAGAITTAGVFSSGTSGGGSSHGYHYWLIWLVVTGTSFIFPYIIILGMSSSQLTKSYFAEG